MSALTPRSVFRRYETEGVPDSGTHEPKKSEIIQLLERIQSLAGTGYVVKATADELAGVTPSGPNAGAVVLGDPDPTRNGYYAVDGTDWVKQRGFPDSFAVLEGVSGTNAVSALTASGVDPADVGLLQLSAVATNTGAMTLSVNGNAPVPLLDFTGAPMAAGFVQAGLPVLVADDGEGHYRLLLDHRFQTLSAATVAAAAEAEAAADVAEDAQDGAEAARDIAAGYASDAVSQGNVPIYATLDGLAAIDVPVGINALRVNGRGAAGDGGAVLLKKVVGAAGPGRWPSATGLWEVSDKILKPDYFGPYVGDGVADDDAAIRKMLQYAKRGHKIVLTPTFAAADGATIIMAGGDLLMRNGIEFEGGGWGIILKQKAGSNPTYGFLVSELVTVDATTDAFQKGKVRPTIRNLYLDCNGGQNTSGHGLVVVADGPLVDNVYIKDAPWCGFRQQHTGLGGTQQGPGLNMLHATLRRVRVDNFGLAFRADEAHPDVNQNIDLDKATAVFIGASQNGKITDGFLSDIAIVSGPRGMYLGSAAGWLGDKIRIANVDDGLVTAQVNRTFLDGIEVDDYGRGWDVAKRAFDAVVIGRMLSRRAHGHFAGQIQTQQGAGATSDFTYRAVRLLNPTTGIMDCEVTADFDIVGDDGALIDVAQPELGVKAGKTVGYTQEQANERSVVGRFEGTMRRVAVPFDMDPDTRIITDVVEVTGTIGLSHEVRGQKTIPAGVATAFATIKMPGAAGGRVEVDFFASRNNGYAVAERSATFSFGRTGGAVAAHKSAAAQHTVLAKSSQSTAARDITDLVLTIGTAGAPVDTLVLNCTPTFAGSQTDTDCRVTWRIRILADKAGLAIAAA